MAENRKNVFIGIGQALSAAAGDWRKTMEFHGEVVCSLLMLLKSPRKLRWSSFFYYLDICGALAVPIVVLICFLLGATMAFQAAIQLRDLGASIYVADLVGFATLKEFGPLMVALIATGRAGSSFAAEIGSMKAEEEISALTTMGINPVRFLVAPKILAMSLALPILTLLGDIASIAGGLLVGVSYLDLTAETYLSRTCNVLSPSVLLLGILKSWFFGIMIALIGCREGFRSQPDSQGVGRAATSAVVRSILWLIILDLMLTMLYSAWGY